MIYLLTLLFGFFDYMRGTGYIKWLWKAWLCIFVILILQISEPINIAWVFTAVWLGYSIGYGAPWGQVLGSRTSNKEKWQFGIFKKSNVAALVFRGTFAGILCLDWRIALAFGVGFLSPYVSKDWPTAEFIRGFTASLLLILLR